MSMSAVLTALQLNLNFEMSGSQLKYSINDAKFESKPKLICCNSPVTRKICDMICLHDRSEIIAWMLTLFAYYIYPVFKRHRFFNAFYISHVYSIELMCDVDYRS